MVTSNFLSSGDLLAVLNRPPDEKKFNRLVKKCRDSNAQVKPRDGQLVFDGHVHWWLRQHVDEWLKTGRNEDDSETPFDRSLMKADAAKRAVDQYIETHTFRVVFDHELNIAIAPPVEPSKSVTQRSLKSRRRRRSEWNSCLLLRLQANGNTRSTGVQPAASTNSSRARGDDTSMACSVDRAYKPGPQNALITESRYRVGAAEGEPLRSKRRSWRGRAPIMKSILSGALAFDRHRADQESRREHCR
jgi:hypothetical protein